MTTKQQLWSNINSKLAQLGIGGNFGDQESAKNLREVIQEYAEAYYLEKATETELFVWVPFQFMNMLTRPKESGKYLICRKDGKIHWETWNGSGWAYNHNEIRFWAEIPTPKIK